MERKGFIGGSDCNRIMSGDWLKLWSEKKGYTEPSDLSDILAVQLGSHTESFNIRWFEKEYVCSVTHDGGSNEKGGSERTLDYMGVPLKGLLDGIVYDFEEGTQYIDVLECKHTYEYNTFEQCLRQYMPQIQFYIWIAKAKGCYLSVIFGNRRWECKYVAEDLDYRRKMAVHIVEFWKCVTEDRAPSTENNISESIDKIPVDEMVRRDASTDNHFVSATADLIKHETSSKLYDSAKATLKELVGDNEREVYTDQLSIKRDKRGSLRFTLLNKEN